MDDLYERPEGVTDGEWDAYMDDIERHEVALVARICPDCGHALMKKLVESFDPEDDEPDEDRWGMWFHYSCVNEKCSFTLDQLEGN